MTGFALLDPRVARPFASAPYDHWLSEQGEATVLFHRRPGGFVVRFLDICDFDIAVSDLVVSCTPLPGTRAETVHELYLNQVVPLILGHRGELVLHGSGVATPAGGLGLIGASGRGKSTLAAAFARAGHPFLTDDGLLLAPDGEGYLARPNNPRFRLCADSEQALMGSTPAERGEDEAEKRAVAANAQFPFQQEPVRLCAIYLLGPGSVDRTGIDALNPSEALASLIRNSFILDVEDRQRMRGHFDRLAELATRQPCFALDFPRQYSYLPQVIADVLDHAGKGDLLREFD